MTRCEICRFSDESVKVVAGHQICDSLDCRERAAGQEWMKEEIERIREEIDLDEHSIGWDDEGAEWAAYQGHYFYNCDNGDGWEYAGEKAPEDLKETEGFTCQTCGESLPWNQYCHSFDHTDQDECLECGQRILDQEEEQEE